MPNKLTHYTSHFPRDSLQRTDPLCGRLTWYVERCVVGVRAPTAVEDHHDELALDEPALIVGERSVAVLAAATVRVLTVREGDGTTRRLAPLDLRRPSPLVTAACRQDTGGWVRRCAHAAHVHLTSKRGVSS